MEISLKLLSRFRGPLLMTSRKMLVLGSVLLAMLAASVIAQDDPFASFVPVTPEMLSNPDDGDWLTFRRTQDHWGTVRSIRSLRTMWPTCEWYGRSASKAGFGRVCP